MVITNEKRDEELAENQVMLTHSRIKSKTERAANQNWNFNL